MKTTGKKLDVQDNGVHEYVETDRYVILRNHGEKRWVGLLKDGGGYRPMGEEPIKADEGIFTGYTVPTFATLEDALAFARKVTK